MKPSSKGGEQLAEGPVAAVDCGTNSTRLLVVGADGRRIDRRMTITRLGAGIDRSGRLDLAAIGRTVSVLSSYGLLLDRYGVERARTRAVATSAARDAANASSFLDAAEEGLGVRPEVIASTEEGRLSYAGATASLQPAEGPYLVVDIGGGSTELIAGTASEPSTALLPATVSLDVGCVRVSERYLRSDPPTASELSAARAGIRLLLQRGVGRAPSDGDVFKKAAVLVGLAGTVSALTVLALGLDAFSEQEVHHARLSREAVGRLTAELSRLSPHERLSLRGMEKERADVIVGGAVVLEEVMDFFGHDELIASEQDILEAITAELLGLPG